MDDFLSLRHLMEENHISPHALVAAIDASGIHRRRDDGKPPIRYDRNSSIAFEAMQVISAYLAEQRGKFDAWDSSPFLSPSDLDTLGWIREEFDFHPTEKQFTWLKILYDKDELGSLWASPLQTLGRYLLMGSVEVSGLATAIETLGIHGIDRFGRVTWHAPQSGDAQRVLDELANYFENRFRLGFYRDEVVQDSIYSEYGWMHTQTPDFKAIEIEHQRSQQIGASQKTLPSQDEDSPNGAKSKMTLIAGLFALVDGRLTGRKHPEYVSQASLVTILSTKLKPLYGSREGAIDLKFADANRILKAHESNLVEAPVSNRRRSKAQPRQSKAPKKPS